MTALLPAPVRLRGPADLRALMRTPYTLSAQQWDVVSAPLEPAVVIAGAGSGKTTVMAARVVYLVATGQVAPDQVLGLTFTTKAASELAARVRGGLEAAGLGRSSPAAVGGAPVGIASGDDDEAWAERLEPAVATYHAYAASLLTEHGLRVGHEPDTRLLADASRYQLAARAVARHTGTVRELTESPAHAVTYLLALESALSEHLVGIEDVRRFHDRQRPGFEAAAAGRAPAEPARVLAKMREREELLELVAGYRAMKARLGLMDFSDQIALAARLAHEHPEVGRLEREKFRVVLLDEYQDTSVAQARLLARLFSGGRPEAGRGHPVTAVGDPHQAIYGWRGASSSNILGFGATFPRADGSPDVPTYPLTVNRRSDTSILEVANRLVSPLAAETPVVRPLEPAAGATPGVVRVSAHRTQAEELTWLADAVVEARASMPEPAWREIGVLARDNATAAAVFDALAEREIPVEIVGLQGLLRLPEVAEVVATLTLLHDLTANAALLTLLTGPRWAIGPRDLALLGRRARELAEGPGGAPPRERDREIPLEEELARAVAGADATEVVALCDALEQPGAPAYSAEARERFGLLAAELRMLRAHAGEPLLDLVRLVIDTTGVDVELAASVSPAAAARRDNLDLFVKAVADFRGIDGAVGLPALLAYLQAEDEMGTGLDIATPSEADSVKLLTVHRAKGLEWDAVFVVGVCAEKFPTRNTRSQWPGGCWVLPSPLRGDAADVPQLHGFERADLQRLRTQAREHEAREELRLAYVALTRARHLLAVSSYLWTGTRASPVGPSPYQVTVKEALEEWGLPVESWLETPQGEENPLRATRTAVPWPVTEHTPEVVRRLEAAALVREAAERGADLGPVALSGSEAVLVGRWDEELERLVAEARRDRSAVVEVPLPDSLSATAVARWHEDPHGFVRELARPMPRPPSRAARFGTRFHAWVEARFAQQDLFDPEELPGRADAGIDSEEDLAVLTAAFEAGPFADRVPLAVEQPFAMVLDGLVVRGRIDAVYADSDAGAPDGFLVVDWKTGRGGAADPLQLALYRQAWAELRGVPPQRVRGAFYHVRSGRIEEPRRLPGRAELERLLSPGAERPPGPR